MEKILFVVGIVSLIVGVFILLFLFNVLKPLLKTEEAKTEYYNWLNNNTKKGKIIAFLLTFSGIFSIVSNNPDNIVSPQTVKANPNHRIWTDTDKTSLTDECVKMYVSQEELADDEVNMAQNYCQCTTEKMTKKFTINELIAHDSLSQFEKMELYEPVVKNCLNDLEYELNERYNQGKMIK